MAAAGSSMPKNTVRCAPSASAATAGSSALSTSVVVAGSRAIMRAQESAIASSSP